MLRTAQSVSIQRIRAAVSSAAQRILRLFRFIATPGSHQTRREVVTAAALLAVLVMAVYPGVVFGNRTLSLGSAIPGVLPTGPYGYPEPHYVPQVTDPTGIEVGEAWHYLASRELLNGRVPFWDPYLGAGTPLVGFSQGAGYFFPQVLFMALPYTSWDAYYLLRFVLSGLFAYIFLRSLRISPLAAFTGSILYMLSGAFTWSSSADWLNAFMLMPLLLWSVQRLSAAPSRRLLWAVCLAVLTWLVLSSGFPEAIALVLLLSGAYFLFCQAQIAQREAGGSPRAFAQSMLAGSLRYAAASVAGACLAAPALFNFLEFLRTIDPTRVQQSLVRFAPLPHYALHLFFPYFYGPRTEEWNAATFVGLRNGFYEGYSGVTGPLLGLVAVVCSLWPRRRPRLRAHALFFAAAFAVILFCSHGGAGAELVSAIPLLRSIKFYRYSAGLWFISLAVLAAIGLDELVSRNWRASALAALLLAGALAALLVPNLSELQGLLPTLSAVRRAAALQDVQQSVFTGSAILVAGIILLAIGARFPRLAQVSLLAVLAGELVGYVPSALPARYNAYTPSPYLSFLRRDAQPQRLMGLDATALPNSAAALGIDDMRNFDALYVNNYSYLIEHGFDQYAFSQVGFTGLNSQRPPGAPSVRDDVIAHQRVLDLLNVRYILTNGTYLGMTAPVYYAVHAPFDLRQCSPLTVGSTIGQVFATPMNGLDSIMLSFAGAEPLSAGSVTLHLRSGPETASDLRAVTLPIAEVQREGVTSFTFAPIPDSGGKTYYMQLSTTDAAAHLALWCVTSTPAHPVSGAYRNGEALPGTAVVTAIGWQPAGSQPAAGDYRIVYNQDVLIYENPQALPRAFVVHRVQGGIPNDRALAQIDDPAFSLGQTLLLADQPPAAQQAQAEQAPATDDSSVRVTGSATNEVVLQANMEHPGYVALQDTYYPGWHAYVDGREQPIYRSDIMFRAVFVPAGHHQITFVYAPASFIAGLLVMLLPPFVLGVWLVISFGLRRVSAGKRHVAGRVMPLAQAGKSSAGTLSK